MSDAVFAAALGIEAPWYVTSTRFDAATKVLTIGIDFKDGSRFASPSVTGQHPVYDSQTKRYRHLNFFQHECFLEVRVPRIKLPDGRVAQVNPPWSGKLSGFTQLFEALVLLLCKDMPFRAVARLTGLSWHRVHAICKRYVELALEAVDLSGVTHLAVDETSSRRGHNYLTIAADAEQRKIVYVTSGRGADTIAGLAQYLREHCGDPGQVESVSIDMSPAFIKGVTTHLPNARITFDKFHIVAAASAAIDKTRRIEQQQDRGLKGMRWKLLKDRSSLRPEERSELDALIACVTSKRTARAWVYREDLREILQRKQINVVTTMLNQWCTNVMRSKVEPMKDVARMIRRHMEGIVAWTQTRQTNGFIEALNGLFQAAKRRARGYVRLDTMRTILFLIAGKLDFSTLNPHAA